MKDRSKISESSTRTIVILKIEALEHLVTKNERMELNEGYQYDLNGSLPQIADGIAKMAAEMDKDPDFGVNGGQMFLTLIGQYYESAKRGNSNSPTSV